MKTSQINKIFIKNLLQDDEIIQKKKKNNENKYNDVQTCNKKFLIV